MTGQYISLTPAQAAAFRSPANRIAQEGDEALVAFVEAEGHEVYLECDELADIAARAAEAYDRITAKEEAERQAKKAAEQAEAAPREFTWEQTRANAVRVISRYAGSEAVVEAMEADMDRIDAKASADIGRTIAEAMKATRSDGKWIFHSWVRDAMRRVRDEAFAKANAAAERMVFIFLSPLLNVWRILSAERVSTRALEMAERMFGEARPAEKWAPWALKALERLIATSHPDLFEVLVDLADEIRAGLAGHRGASALINGMMARIPGLINEAKKKIAREKAEKESARRARQMERAAMACKKGSKKK